MSHYIERYCTVHGDWSMDVDCPSECPQCEDVQKDRIRTLEAELEKAKAEIVSSQGSLEIVRKCRDWNKEQADSLRAELARCVEVMRRMEWIEDNDGCSPDFCPCCKNGDPDSPSVEDFLPEFRGHDKDCALSLRIAAAEKLIAPKPE